MVMKIKAASLGLWLLASADAAQFTQSFLEYSAKEVNHESPFDEWKETVTASYGSRRLTHTLPPFVVPRQCQYSALNHTPTSTTPVDQMVCPNQCGTGQDFTLRIETTCDKPYQQADAKCSSVITCNVKGCTNGAITCPATGPLGDLDAALEQVCTALCVSAPAPVPVAPVPAPVPVAPPVPVPTAPVPAPSGIVTPVAPSPVVTPVAPSPVVTPVAPSPVVTPVAPSPVFVPTPTIPTPTTPTEPTVVVPTAPIISPVMPVPTQDLPNCYSDTTLLLQAMVNADTSIVTTYSLCSNRVYNIGTLMNTAQGTTLTGGMAPLTARTNSHFICGATGDISNNCVLSGGEVQVISAFSLYQEPVTNCRFQGFTFSMAQQAGAALDNSGDVTFQDCIFENHSNVGPMLLTWDPTAAVSTEPPINIGALAAAAVVTPVATPVAAPAWTMPPLAPVNTPVVRHLKETNKLQQVMNNMGAAMESVRRQNNAGLQGRKLWFKYADESSITRQQEFVNENHSLPPSLTPPGCAYSFQHTDAVFMDEIYCPGYCGTGRDFTYTVTTVCSGNDCDTFTDCRVKGCNDACGDMVNDCACASQGVDAIFDNVCNDVCTAGPVSGPVLPPIAGPTPVGLPVAVPTPALPVAFPTPELPIAVPTPALPVAVPTPALPVAVPTPALPVAVPTPALPVAVPTPALPVAVPTPVAPIPTAPLPSPILPTPTIEIPTVVTPTDPGLPRQKVFLMETTFRGNTQGQPIPDSSRGVITTASGYNDIVVDSCNFQSNTYNQEGFGYGILAVEGSSVAITNTNFIGNDFTGSGAVVALNGGAVSATNNYGTLDEGLPCQFIAASAGSVSEAQCIPFDRTTEVLSPSPTPIVVPTPDIAPVTGKRTSKPIAPVNRPVQESRPVQQSQPVPASKPVRESRPVREEKPNRDSKPNRPSSEDRSKGNSSAKKSKKSKKSKSSSYCDDGSEKVGKRCLKRKST